ncbi:MAG: MbnP family protein [Cyclobacteriaceae bacterium]
MKRYTYFIISLLVTVLFSACQEDEGAMTPDIPGALSIEFDNYVGSQPMQLDPVGSTDYRYITGSGQEFNLSTFRYYISNIKLEGPDGASFEDEMNASANADEVRGYYLVQEGESSSYFIDLDDVPTGQYNRITFTLGIPEEGVQEGAAGGILDPAEGAWFWTWNSGYIGLGMEGTAADSPQERVERDGFVTEANTFALHVGGWKEVEGNDNMVDNTRTVTLDFGDVVTVGQDVKPKVHVVFDMLEILDGAGIDFSQTFQVHAPRAAIPMADEIPEAFTVDHVHQ